MADKPSMGFKGGYNSSDANSMLSELYPAIAKTAKMGLSNMWNGMDTTSKAATVAGLVPGIGDVAGVANDARLFYQNPEMRTPANFGLSALGLLPFVPGMGTIKGVGKGMAGSIVPPIDVVKNIKPKPIKAPASNVGFYSPVEKAALNLKRNQGSGQSFLNDLKKGENVKGDELTYTELEDWLKTKPNLTKQEVQDYIANNKLDVKEVVFGGKKIQYPHTTPDEWQGAINQAERARNFDEAERLTLAWEDFEGLGQNTKYAKYQLPNGNDYKEILLTLPEKTRPATLAEVNAAKAKISDFLPLMTQKEYDDLVRSGEVPKINTGERQYKSSHWDKPNVLAHIRINRRIDANGKKTTLIEEIQSDWHQAGREKGYATDTKPQLDKIRQERKILLNKQDEYLNLVNPYTSQGKDVPQNIIEGWTDVQNKLQELQRQEDKINITKGGVPDAPFKEDWYKLALKRAIKEAVDNGSESISLTTGSRQAERYDLSKQVDEIISIRNEDGTFNLRATMPNGEQEVSIGNNISADKLQDYVGKDLATSMQKQGIGGDVYSGDSLKVGGEGMKKYYDEIYPAFLNKFGKKYGVKVEDNIIDIGKPEKVYTLPITPQMREDVLKGQPLTDKNEQDKNQYYA